MAQRLERDPADGLVGYALVVHDVVEGIHCYIVCLRPDVLQGCRSSWNPSNELNDDQLVGRETMLKLIDLLPLDLEAPGSDYEKNHIDILNTIKDEVPIPISVKLTPQITSIPHLAKKLADAGTDGLVFFNWFLEPDIDIKTQTTKNVKGHGHLFETLRWVALLADRVDCDISSSGGVKDSDDVVKLILAGASAVQACGIFYEKGLEEIEFLIKGLQDWMKSSRFSAIDEFRGNLSFYKQDLSFRDKGEAEAYFRNQYVKTYSKFE